MNTETKLGVAPLTEGFEHLPFSLPLELTIHDRETIAELCAFLEGEQCAQNALRIGVLALKQARGEVDAVATRRESERLLKSLQSRLGEHANIVHERLISQLKASHVHVFVDRVASKFQLGDIDPHERLLLGYAGRQIQNTGRRFFDEHSHAQSQTGAEVRSRPRTVQELRKIEPLRCRFVAGNERRPKLGRTEFMTFQRIFSRLGVAVNHQSAGEVPQEDSLVEIF